MFDELKVIFAILVAIIIIYILCVVNAFCETPSQKTGKQQRIEQACWHDQWADTYATQAAYLERRKK